MSILGFLEHAAHQYYVVGKPIISDEEFDVLVGQSGYSSVGSKVREGVEHFSRLYSLEKYYVGEKEPSILGYMVETPKLDGLAISLTYVNGVLVTMLRRGDGIYGTDISHLIPAIDVPKVIPMIGVYQIAGEVCVPESVENFRNVAAGALNLSSWEECKSRNLSFIAYSVAPFISNFFTDDMKSLEGIGFKTVLSDGIDIFPTDGRVFRLDNNEEFVGAGFTSKHPKGAYALKTRSAGVVTTLLDVTWSTAKSGVVAPVAVLEPIHVGDALVSKATLHNFAIIESLDLEIGCKVEVIRAGEIIPRIVRRVYE